MVYPYDKGMFVQRVVSPFKTFHQPAGKFHLRNVYYFSGKN